MLALPVLAPRQPRHPQEGVSPMVVMYSSGSPFFLVDRNFTRRKAPSRGRRSTW